MNHLSNWEESIRSGLANHEVATPAMGWEKLESALRTAAAAGVASSSTPKQQPAAQPTAKPWLKTWWGKSAVGAATVAVAASVAVVAVHQSEESLQQAVSPALQTAGQASAPQLEAAEPSAVEPLVALSSKPTAEPVAKSTAPAEEDVPLLKSATKLADIHTQAESAAEEHATETDHPSTISEYEATHTDAEQADWTRSARSTGRTYYEPAAAKQSTAHRTSHRPTLAMHVSTPTTQRMNQQGGYYSPPVSLPTGNVHTLSVSQIDFAHVVGTNLDKKVESRVRHKMPFQFGLSVSVPLTKKWSVRTGVTYTRLSTDIQAGSDVAYYVTQQNLHYVGVPVTAAYTIYASRFFNVYAAAGATLEKCVKAKRTVTFDNTSSKRSTASETEGFADGLWQFSLNASAGMQFNITPAIGLYFEPGVSYFLNDGSNLPNIRHEHPANFNMQGGLRYSF